MADSDKLIIRPLSAARAWFALTALIAGVGVGLQAFDIAGYHGGHFVTGRLFSVFSLFTIQSNVLVCATGCTLALRPHTSSTVFRVFWFAALIDIIITAIVYHTLLDGHASIADVLLHTVVPLMIVAGWLVFGPRGFASARVAAWAALIPLGYIGFILVRGPIVHSYPYGFLDVRALGYTRVLLNSAFLALLFVGLAVGAIVIDRRLPRRV